MYITYRRIAQLTGNGAKETRKPFWSLEIRGSFILYFGTARNKVNPIKASTVIYHPHKGKKGKATQTDHH